MISAMPARFMTHQDSEQFVHLRGYTPLGFIFTQRFTRAVFEVDPFLLDHQGPLLDKGVYGADVFADDAHKQHLDRHKEKHSNDQRSDANGKATPKDKLVD